MFRHYLLISVLVCVKRGVNYNTTKSCSVTAIVIPDAGYARVPIPSSCSPAT